MGKRLQPELIIVCASASAPAWVLRRCGVPPWLLAPLAGDTDADHGRVSHLCANGDTDPRTGAACILALAQQMKRYQISGA